MTAIALRRRLAKVAACLRVIGRLQGRADRGWQDKSRKVRPVGRLGNVSYFNHAPNIAKTRQNLPILLGRWFSSVFDTLRRVR
jgi:hypothetical protein